jgi:DNA polymerase-3 subunit alpha
MKYLFFDLETTGLPERRLSSFGEYFSPKYFSHYKNSRIVSIAWMIYTDTGLLEKQHYYIVKPDNFKSSARAIEVHKITEEIAQRDGVPINDIMTEFRNDLNECDLLLSYNIDFDYNIFLSECYRYAREDLISLMNIAKQYCIMKKSKEILKTINGMTKRYFKLEEVYREVFSDKEFSTAHNSLDDTLRCAQVYFKLIHGLTLE